jgi:hypothetical protein
MSLLVVKKHVCAKGTKEITFAQPAQKQALIYSHAPIP